MTPQRTTPKNKLVILLCILLAVLIGTNALSLYRMNTMRKEIEEKSIALSNDWIVQHYQLLCVALQDYDDFSAVGSMNAQQFDIVLSNLEKSSDYYAVSDTPFEQNNNLLTTSLYERYIATLQSYRDELLSSGETVAPSETVTAVFSDLHTIAAWLAQRIETEEQFAYPDNLSQTELDPQLIADQVAHSADEP